MERETLRGVQQLFQVTPANNAAVSVMSKVAKRKVIVLTINIVNTTSSSATYSLFLDQDGTTYNSTTALAYNVALAANTQAIVEYNNGLPLNYQSAGNLAVQAGTANAITFTGFGIEL